LFDDLETPPPPVNADWSVLSIQPDFILQQPGYYDGLAQRNNPSLGDAFEVTFIWRGQGLPSAQSFDIHDVNFAILASGQTLTVPEPGTLSLGLAGVMASLVWRRMQKR